MEQMTLEQSDAMIHTQYGISRSGKWPAAEKRHLEIQPACLVCGTTKKLAVHHVYPFHFVIALGRPDLEIDERNLRTLCSGDQVDQHHLLVGHLDDWQSYNPQLEHSIAFCHLLTARQIRSLPHWLLLHANKPPHLSLMSNQQRSAMLVLLNRLMPVEAKASYESVSSLVKDTSSPEFSAGFEKILEESKDRKAKELADLTSADRPPEEAQEHFYGEETTEEKTDG